MTATDHRPAIRRNDQVRVNVNDLGGTVTGTVLTVYTDSAGEAAAIDLGRGRIFHQATQFLTVVTER